MRSARFLSALVFLTAPALWGQYQWLANTPLAAQPGAPWQISVSSTLTFGSTGATASDASGGDLLYNNGSGNVQVRATYRLTSPNANANGTYTIYYDASSDARRTDSGSTGSFYALELQNPTFSGALCGANLVLYKVVNGVETLLAQTSIACADGMQIRMLRGSSTLNIIWPTGNLAVYDSTLPSGLGGVGVRDAPSGNGIVQVDIGPGDSINPLTPPAPAVSSWPTHIDLQWPGAADNANGSGIWEYELYRQDPNSQGNYLFVADLPSPAYRDPNVSAGVTYSYALFAIDYGRNYSSPQVSNVTAPPATSVDPRLPGLRPSGSYWGALGEQIDMRSGNLNDSIQLITSKGRAGVTAKLGLSYNSQNWRTDNGQAWLFGQDVGYGFGWQMQIGSVTPYYQNYNTVVMYLLRDASGAEYRLDQNSGNVWTSKEPGMYVAYDANQQRVYAPDGSYWIMGAQSGGLEQDAGTRYPTMVMDTNGNQIRIDYMVGQQVADSAANSSARVQSVWDPRSTGNGATYTFHYSQEALPHLTSISNRAGTSESYTLAYQSQTLTSPFSPNQTYNQNNTVLSSVQVDLLGLSYSFQYDNGASTGPAELTQLRVPTGGTLHWNYRTFTYNGNRQLREVQNRTLNTTSNGSGDPQIYYFSFDDTGTSSQYTSHYQGLVTDRDGQSTRQWLFATSDTPTNPIGLEYSFRQFPGGSSTVLYQRDVSYAADTTGRPYLQYMVSKRDVANSADGRQSQTRQDLDQWGNVLNRYEWDAVPMSGTLSPNSGYARVYTNYYLTDATYNPNPNPSPAYSSRHIFNRLLSTTLNGNSVVKNTYDGCIPQIDCRSLPDSYQSAMGHWLHDDINYSYDMRYRGNVSSSTPPSGDTTYYGYDMTGFGLGASMADGRSVQITAANDPNQTNSVPGTITPNGLSAQSVTLNYNSFLQVSSEQLPNGASASFAYDALSRPASTTSPWGAISNNSYSGYGALPYTQTASMDAHDGSRYPASAGNGRYTKTTMDGLGRPVKSQTYDGGGNLVSTVDTVYAACGCTPVGKVQKVSRPYAPNGTVYWTVYTYDAIGRTTNVLLPDGASHSTYSYVGNTVTVTDPAGHWKTYTTDAWSNLTQVVEPNPDSTTSGWLANYTTSYTYDAFNHLTQVSMPRPAGSGQNTYTQTRTFHYNTLQQMDSTTLPENGLTQYSYNLDGSLNYKIDAKGQKSSNEYDSQRRLTVTHRYFGNGAEDACNKVTYTYDVNTYDVETNPASTYYGQTRPPVSPTSQNGDPAQANFSQNSQGRLVARVWNVGASCSGGKLADWYSYTPEGGVTTKRFKLYVHLRPDGVTPTDVDANYTYNNEGQRLTTVYPTIVNGYGVGTGSGETVTTTYDALARPSGTTASRTGAIWTGLTYNAAGQPGWFSYNMMGQITGAAYFTYTYSSTQNNGQILSMQEGANGQVETITYQYDQLNRLINATATNGPSGNAANNYTETYAYDGWGNRTQQQRTTPSSSVTNNYSFAPATNQITLDPRHIFDANGNDYGFQGAQYDVDNRVVVINGPNPYTDPGEQYAYAPGNKRVYKRINAGSGVSDEYYFLDTDGKRLAVITWDSTYTTYQIGKTSFYLAGRKIWDNGKSITFDRLGSVVYRTNGESPRYYPYGEERTPTSNDWDKFGTYHRDNTGVDYADQRFYGSSFGRFLTADPLLASARLDRPQTWNRFTYAHNDPLNAIDPTGLDDGGMQIVGAGAGCVDKVVDGIEQGCDGDTGIDGQDGGSSGVAADCAASNLLYNAETNSCYEPEPPAATQPPPPNCSDMLSLEYLTPDRKAAMAVLLGEDSWIYIGNNQYNNGDSIKTPTGTTITVDTVKHEEELMMSVIENRLNNGRWGNSITSVVTARRQFLGYATGVGALATAMDPSTSSDSDLCEHVQLALGVSGDVLSNPSAFQSNFMSWRSTLQGPRGHLSLRRLGPNDFRIGRTDFF